MSRHVSGILKSHTATMTPQGGAYVKGKWVENIGTPVTNIDANVQPATEKEFETLNTGERRITDLRRVSVNTTIAAPKTGDIWEFDGELTGEKFECIKLDYRPSRHYLKVWVSLLEKT